MLATLLFLTLLTVGSYNPQSGVDIFGYDEFRFTLIEEGTNLESVEQGVVSITVRNPIQAANLTIAAFEGQPVQIALVGTHASGTAVVTQVLSLPQRGRLTVGGAPAPTPPFATTQTLVYTPTDPEAHGLPPDGYEFDAFTYNAAIPGGSASATAHVRINVRPVNDPPVLTLLADATPITGKGVDDEVVLIPFPIRIEEPDTFPENTMYEVEVLPSIPFSVHATLPEESDSFQRIVGDGEADGLLIFRARLAGVQAVFDTLAIGASYQGDTTVTVIVRDESETGSADAQIVVPFKIEVDATTVGGNAVRGFVIIAAAIGVPIILCCGCAALLATALARKRLKKTLMRSS
jgi:hypothetical protein